MKQKLASADYQFAKTITSMPSKQQHVLWIKLYSFLLLPIIGYAGLMLLISIKHQFYFTFFATILSVFLLLAFLTIYTFRFSNFTFYVVKNWINLPAVAVNKPFWTWPLYYLLKEQRMMLLICKVFSILSFKVILLVFADVGNDIRVYLTALLAVVLSHAVLIFNLIKFDAFYAAFAKNLPISAIKRLCYWLLVFMMFLIPELIQLVWLSDLNTFQLINCLFFCVATMLGLQMLVYLLKADMERYMKYLLFFFFVSMLAILAGHYFLFSLLLISFAVVTFFWKYNRLDLKEIA
ncbi:hypothetical protein [Pedobacter sp. Hv1]|uniref:hypothetical protein n=1 Tax=Pedobacter sp. Hv1 TaxID=1740090 RepID=UPI001F276CFF|nr:hypothetical protein [Pedobacter sp. Hv1]